MKSRPKTLSALIYVPITVDKNLQSESLSINNNVQKNVTVLIIGHFVCNEDATFRLGNKVVPEARGKHFTAAAIVGKRQTSPTVSDQTFL